MGGNYGHWPIRDLDQQSLSHLTERANHCTDWVRVKDVSSRSEKGARRDVTMK
jgi:hypothetical protein